MTNNITNNSARKMQFLRWFSTNFYSTVKGGMTVSSANRDQKQKGQGQKYGRAWPIFKQFHSLFSPAFQFTCLSPWLDIKCIVGCMDCNGGLACILYMLSPFTVTYAAETFQNIRNFRNVSTAYEFGKEAKHPFQVTYLFVKSVSSTNTTMI